MQSILLIKGQSTYDSTYCFLNEMQAEWETMGYEVTEFSRYHVEQMELLLQQMNAGREFDLIFSLNGMMLENELLNPYLQKTKPIYCTMLMDHPLHHHDRLSNPYDRIFVLSPDENHVNYLEKYSPNIWAEAFFAHSGCAAETIVPYREREILLSFVGSYFNSAKMKEKFAVGNQNTEIFLNLLADCMEKQPEVTIEQAQEAVFAALGIKPSAQEFAENLTVAKPADMYVRAYYREQVIKALLRAKIPVDVYGNGWESFACENKEYLRVHPPLRFVESLQVTANSKFSLNVMPWFKAGSHDRVFTAMACGAVALSDESKYWESFGKEGSMLLYSLRHLEKMTELVQYYAAHEDEAERVAARGRQAYLSQNTWAHRAREVIQYLEELEGLSMQ